MLDCLLDHALSIAKKINSKVVVVISRNEPKVEDNDIQIFQAPRSYVTMLESLFFTLEQEFGERLIGKSLVERSVAFMQTKDYISTFLYFKGIDLKGKAVGVVDVDAFKGIIVVDLEQSRLQKALAECAERVNPNVLRAVLTVAMSIAQKGREGRKIGTAFIIGDVEEVLKRSSQLIINPYECHPISERDITNPETWESIREFAQLDGVFVIDESGIIVAAGRYLEVSSKDLKLKKGFGGRHLACAAITRETEAIAVVVSESGGDIRIYKDGGEIIEIDVGIYT
ncbi:MAG TPA: diadenylate cyclase [Archaeoglobus profundus]|nr:diadenylate cyclase [Archaeoglobus profundus]